MIQTVVKRDGRIVGFNEEKIATAIRKAMLHTQQGEDIHLIRQITDRISFKGNPQMTVEDIQDAVEWELMNSSRKDVAQKYIAYRNQRSIARKAKTRNVFLDIINIKSNDVTRENANMNADTPAGMMMKFASETTKPFVDDYLLSEEVRVAVENNYLHIHDKDYYPTKSLTCVQHPLDRILHDGFSAGHGESRPAKRIETASILGCISLETAQNEMHGGQAIPAFDFYLAPYVRDSFIEELKTLEQLNGVDYSHLYQVPLDDYLEKPLDGLTGEARILQHAMNRTVARVHQSMEAFIHNMNTIHSRGGNQVVFSSINYGTDTSAEGRCIIRELLKSTYRGVGNGETAIFPIQIWKKKRGVSYLPEDRNYDLYKLACQVTARRFFPNFLNLDATFNQSEAWQADDPKRYLHEVATMGCRTRVFENRFGPKTSIGRGNLSFSTINIVRLAIECMHVKNQEERIALFFSKLDAMLELTARQLHERLEFQKTAYAKQFPLLMKSLWLGCEQLKPTDTITSVINQGTLGIGFIGLAECLVALVGKHHGEDASAQELGLKIVSYMRDRANQFSEQYQHNYSVLATPAEGLSGKFTRRDCQRFGSLPGITDRDYYTNSNHVPVYYKCSARHKAEIEAPYHDLTRGGHIFYVEIDGDATHNPEVIMQVVDMMDKYNMGYGSVNHNRNRCLDCGYENAAPNLEVCPKCGSHHLDKLQRITGYLVGTTDRWNQAKLAELHDRVTHD
ncbi:anaerobic ribonucleoside-triphosphate reductase [Parabacteroides sp. An277]|uniref:anaerobic ribonucleoside triphosphate reductase n=1 Tax=Parabacteroides sp. An277 TaxID=1965619 RepID=UPI000B36F345|nr:anaerobic ribonucleoside triphosphate reductase [Parabacteroides sp. An277]OUO51948.1 anaerobic ribonucleoside-triphosphate reductase [Parabacteroides sp. An277]